MKLTISGCEDYYNPAAKKKKAELASSLGADLKSDEFSMFIKLLKNSGVLKGNLLIPDKSASGGLSGKLGGRQGGGRAGRPGAGRLGPGRPGLGRPRGLHGGRPRKGGRLRGPGGRRRPRPRIPSYDYYDYDYDYDYQEAQPASPEAPAESRSFAQSPVGRRPRPPSQPQVIIARQPKQSNQSTTSPLLPPRSFLPMFFQCFSCRRASLQIQSVRPQSRAWRKKRRQEEATVWPTQVDRPAGRDSLPSQQRGKTFSRQNSSQK